MKTFGKFFVATLMALSVAACSKQSKVEDLRQEYIEACADGNFDEARKLLDKMEGIVDNSWEMDDHIKYVNDKEIYTLLAVNSRDNSNRIMYLFNTYETDQLPDMTDVLEVAISQDNDYLAEKLLKGGITPDQTTAKAVVAAENIELMDIVLQKKPDLLLEEGVANLYYNEKGKDALKKALLELWNNTPSNDRYNRDKISAIAKNADINDFKDILAREVVAEIEEKVKEIYKIKVPTCPAIGRVRSDHYGEIPEEYTTYKAAVEEYNNECLTVINFALDNDQPALAKRVLSVMKPNLEWNNLGDWEDVVTHSGNSSVYNAFMVKQNRTEIEAARQLIEQYNS